MTDPSVRKSSPVPAIIMGLVVLLLTTFLVLKWMKSDSAVIPPAPPVVRDQPQKKPEQPAQTPAAPVPEEAQKKTEHEKKMAEGQKAFDEKHYEEAQKIFEEAKKLGVNQSQADEGIEKARQVLEQAKRAQREQEIRAILAEAQKLQEERKWDALFQLYQETRKNYPDFVDLVETQEKQARSVYQEALAAYRKLVEEGQKVLGAGKFREAREKLQAARRFHPDGPEAKEFQKEIREKVANRSMVRIAESDSIVGDDTREDEKPRRTVHLKTFWIDAYEVTNEEYAVFVADTGYAPPRSPFWKGKEPVPGVDKYPVVYVSRADAEAYAAWAGKRLPVEEEWEKAARFIDGRTYPWGNTFMETPNKYPCSSFEYVEQGTVPAMPSPVGSFPQGASPYGVHDLAGNVWEWTSARAQEKKDDQTLDRGVLKGGSFMTPKDAIRGSNRLLEDPDQKLPDAGFRCVKDK